MCGIRTSVKPPPTEEGKWVAAPRDGECGLDCMPAALLKLELLGGGLHRRWKNLQEAKGSGQQNACGATINFYDKCGERDGDHTPIAHNGGDCIPCN